MKYTGSKSRISKDLCNIFNRIIYENGIKHYVEPFVGGANVIENIILTYGEIQLLVQNIIRLVPIYIHMIDDTYILDVVSKERGN